MSSAVTYALGREVVRLDEVADRLADTGAEPVLVRAARSGGDAVDVAAKILLRRFSPLHHELDLHAVLFFERERRLVHRLDVPVADDLLQVIDEAFLVLKDVFLSGGLVFEVTFTPRCRCCDLEAPRYRRVEFDFRENRGSG